MSLVLLFPGQGVQHAAMLPWLDEPQHPCAAAAAATPALSALTPLSPLAMSLGANWRARLSDAAWAHSNAVAQCLITGVSLAAWQVLAPHLPRPVAVAGYSVGELAAAAAAGVFDAAAAQQLARLRASAMDACAARRAGGLLALTGLSTAAVDGLCARFGLSVAIRIGADRCVLGGPLAGLAAAEAAGVVAGAQGVVLRVQVASHTPAMAEAARSFAAGVAPLPWQAANCVVATNLDGRGRRDVAALKHALAQQLAHTVHWDRCMDTLAERRPRCVLEVGPGTSLARMWSARHPDVPVRSVDEFHSAQAVVAWTLRALS